MKVFAIITLLHPLSRAGSDRWGPFVRGRGMNEHRWLGDKNEGRLTVEEFNEQFPRAVKFAGPDRPLVGRILVESEESGEDGPSLSVQEHESKIAEIQAGLNAWTEEHNQKLAAAQVELDARQRTIDDLTAKIAELEKGPPVEIAPTTPASESPGTDGPVGDVNDTPSTSGPTEPLSTESPAPATETPEESEPSSAGAQDSATSPPAEEKPKKNSPKSSKKGK